MGTCFLEVVVLVDHPGLAALHAHLQLTHHEVGVAPLLVQDKKNNISKNSKSYLKISS